MQYTRHIVADMDETMVQRCLICGEVISDYRTCMYEINAGVPKGWAAGELFVRGGNPRITNRNIGEGDTFINCK